MIKFSGYYAGTAVAVLITGYIQVSSASVLLLDQHLGSKTLQWHIHCTLQLLSYPEAVRTTVLFPGDNWRILPSAGEEDTSSCLERWRTGLRFQCPVLLCPPHFTLSSTLRNRQCGVFVDGEWVIWRKQRPRFGGKQTLLPFSPSLLKSHQNSIPTQILWTECRAHSRFKPWKGLELLNPY